MTSKPIRVLSQFPADGIVRRILTPNHNHSVRWAGAGAGAGAGDWSGVREKYC